MTKSLTKLILCAMICATALYCVKHVCKCWLAVEMIKAGQLRLNPHPPSQNTPGKAKSHPTKSSNSHIGR